MAGGGGGGSQQLLCLNPTTVMVVLLLGLGLLLGCDNIEHKITCIIRCSLNKWYIRNFLNITAGT